MKITKFLFLALSLMLFSCSKEDESVTVNSQTEFQLKGGGLNQQQVEQLRADCYAFSTSTEYLNMASKAKDFSNMMNHNYDKTLTTRADFETWLDNNLSLTQFATKQDALDMLDDLESKTITFYDANSKFYDSMLLADEEQTVYILEPIQPQLQTESTSFCAVGCVTSGISGMINEIKNYQSMVNNAYNLTSNSQQRAYLLSQAQFSLQAGINHVSFMMQNCLENC